MSRIISADDFVTKIVALSKNNLDTANAFAQKMLLDSNFTHFKHTLPEDMLSPEWEVWMITYGELVIGWGQIQKFPNSRRKEHVCRVGFAILPEFRGRRLGSEMFDFIMKKCDTFHKITATTFTDNIIMLGMFLRRGFIIEGCFRNEEIQNGIYRHVLSLARYQ